MVEIWEREVADLPLPSNLSREETLKPLYIKTGGKLGLLDKVIRKAAILSLKKGLKSIDKATLHEVLERFE